MNSATCFGLAICILSTLGCTKKEGEAPSSVSPTLVFTTGQAASFVLGQPDFTSSALGTTASTFRYPLSITVSAAGVVYVADQNNSRVLGFASEPVANGVAATTVLGQSSLTGGATGTSSSELYNAHGVSSLGTQVFIADWANHRVTIYNSQTTGAGAAVAIGQASTATGTDPGAGVTATTMRFPYGVFAAAGKLIIADSNYNRVSLYNSIPSSSGAAASVVLGQTDKTSSASGVSKMNAPRSVWTDGTKILVADTQNHRVLGWNTWPTVDGTVPDFILGQSNLTTNTANNGGVSASSLANPGAVFSNGTEVFVSDSGNNRVLIWSTWPTANKQAANLVLGQANFTTAGSGLTATALNNPREGLFYQAPRLYVSDTDNSRVLVYIKQ